MRKKQFKQFTVLKYKKRTKGSDVVFFNNFGRTNKQFKYSAPNRIINTVFGFLGVDLKVSGFLKYNLSNNFDELGCFSLYRNTLVYGSWVDLIIKCCGGNLSLQSPLNKLVFVSAFLKNYLILILNAGILFRIR